MFILIIGFVIGFIIGFVILLDSRNVVCTIINGCAIGATVSIVGAWILFGVNSYIEPTFSDTPTNTINIVAFANSKGMYFRETDDVYTYMTNKNDEYQIKTIEKQEFEKNNSIIKPIKNNENKPKIEVYESFNPWINIYTRKKYIIYIPKDSITSENYSINVEN